MDHRKEALQILSELTPLRISKPQNRTNEFFLASPHARPEVNVLPQDWPEGWCRGWAFAVQPTLAEAMDVHIVTRSKSKKILDANGKSVQQRNPDGSLKFTDKGRPEYEVDKIVWQEWSQGSWFDFREGYTIHDAPEAWTLPWGQALKYIKYSLQIVDAIPVTPATHPLEERKATATLPYRPAAEGIPRFRGEVTFQIYRPNAACTALERHSGLRTVSQDEFVRILINGLPDEWR